MSAWSHARAALRVLASALVTSAVLVLGTGFIGALVDPATAGYAGGEAVNPRSWLGLLAILGVAMLGGALGLLVAVIAPRRLAVIAGCVSATLSVLYGIVIALGPGFGFLAIMVGAVLAPSVLLGSVWFARRRESVAPASAAGT